MLPIRHQIDIMSSDPCGTYFGPSGVRRQTLVIFKLNIALNLFKTLLKIVLERTAPL